MKNVLLITPKLVGGGAERLAADLSVGFNNKYNVILVTYQKSLNEYPYNGERVDLNSFGTNKLQKILVCIKRYIAVRKIKKKNHIDCSISFLPHIDYINIFTKRRNEKVILDVVSNMSLAFPAGWKKKFRQYILKKADWLVCSSQGVKDDIIRNFGVDENRTSVIYNTCNIESQINALPDHTYIRSLVGAEGFKVVTAGSFRHPKGHWHLLKAFSLVLRKHPDAALIILGDGPYRSQYEELINTLGLSGRVFLPGFINNPQTVIKACDIFAFSSIYEGFGNVVIEALACGIPVVSADCPYGPREILAPDTSYDNWCTDIEMAKYGIITPAFGNAPIDLSDKINAKEEKFAEAINLLLENTDLRQQYGQKGLEGCQRFSIQEISDQWVKIIERN